MKLILGSCQVDLATRVVSDGDEEQQRLTSTEVALLAYLVEHSPNIVSREELYREVWEHTAALQTRTLDLAVLRLRKKIEADSKTPQHILTVYGKGYCFVPCGGQTGNLQPVSGPRPQSNLEREENRFIGRRQELDALDALDADSLSHSSLITILGPGGTGKTRLAKHWAEARLAAGRFGAVFFFDLTEARGPLDILRCMATTLDADVSAADDDPDKVVQAMIQTVAAEEEPLLVFDNAEQVVDALRPILQDIWQAETGVRLLVTSQVPLGLSLERRFPLAPFPAPDLGQDDFEDSPSIALFVERAQAVLPSFEITADNREAVAAIVTELDCLPLAIELAAARIQLMPPATLLSRLTERFRLLGRPNKNNPGKHETLEAALRWSWDLLGPPEQEALAQCSVFRGGFEWEAVEAVVSPSQGEDDPWSVDLVAELVDRSLVMIREDPDRRGRLYLLSSVADYAAARLADRGEEEALQVQERHAAHYAGLRVRKRSLEHTSKPQLERINRELDNLLVALQRAIEAKWVDSAVDCCWAVMTSHWQHGIIQESLVYGREVLRLEASPEQRAEVLLNLGWLQTQGRRFDEARESYQEAIETYDELGHRLQRGAASHGLGVLNYRLGNYEAALQNFHDAVAIAEEMGTLKNAGMTLNGLGNLYMSLGRLDEAQKSYEKAVGFLRGLGHWRFDAIVAFNMGRLCVRRGNREDARTLFEKALGLLSGRGPDSGLYPKTLSCLALLDAEAGAFEAASSKLDQARERLQGTDRAQEILGLLCVEGRVAFLRGDQASALQILAEAEGLVGSHRHPPEADIRVQLDDLRLLLTP
jgi:predicted ATPase/DNA-binding winged helix-turn-helix (wHTH) protein/predicted negative regulator of RcsB-dependent stress response